MSFLQTVFLALLLLSLSTFVHVQVVLGKPVAFTHNAYPSSRAKIVLSKEAAQSNHHAEQQHPERFLHKKAEFPSLLQCLSASSSSQETTSKCSCDRRQFFMAAAAAVLGTTTDMAKAEQGNSTDVDWDSFGASLQQYQSAPPVGGAGGSDLGKALQDSAKRKTIDPRTHG